MHAMQSCKPASFPSLSRRRRCWSARSNFSSSSRLAFSLSFWILKLLKISFVCISKIRLERLWGSAFFESGGPAISTSYHFLGSFTVRKNSFAINPVTTTADFGSFASGCPLLKKVCAMNFCRSDHLIALPARAASLTKT